MTINESKKILRAKVADLNHWCRDLTIDVKDNKIVEALDTLYGVDAYYKGVFPRPVQKLYADCSSYAQVLTYQPTNKEIAQALEQLLNNT